MGGMEFGVPQDPRPRGRPLSVLVLAENEDEGRTIAARLQRGGHPRYLAERRGLGEIASLVPNGTYDAVLLSVEDPGPALAALRLVRHTLGRTPVLVIAEGLEAAQADLLREEGAQELLERTEIQEPRVPLLERAIDWAVERAELGGELERARQVGMHLAHHDTLTDLPNRQFFRSRLRQLLAQARRHKRLLAVLFLDLDRFKQINDTLGHTVGDRLLVEVARRLSGCIRETDLAARRGGDEFTVILDGIRRGQDAARVARKILLALQRPFHVDQHELFMGVSIGISLFPADGQDVETLVKHADIAMYRAKAQGGATYRFFLPDMNDKALERLALEQSLRLAIEREEFVLHYQPRVDMKSGRVIGMEALVRWQHPDLGLIYPDEFIPVAEETGLIEGLGRWVLQTACAQNRRWQDEGLPRITVAVNFSARQFQHKHPVDLVRRALDKSGLAPDCLEIELTESAVMQDAAVALETLSELREIGVAVAIDDFGMGQSSLSYLKRFPITTLKIDKTFVRTLLVDPKDAAITEAIIAMAHSLRLRACAEGVETPQQLEFLRQQGCDEVQGYVFSPPLPVDRATELLAGARPQITVRA